MNPVIRSVLAGSVLLSMPTGTQADDLRCGENIVSPGVTEQEVLAACGQPTSVDGAVWTYRMAGSFPRKLTFGNGELMFIEAGEAAGLADKPDRFGDHP